MIKKSLVTIREIFQKNKHNKKFWAILSFNVFCYLIAFPLGLFVSILWWFFITDKIKGKTKKAITYSILGLFFLLTTWGVWGYSTDPEPNLTLESVENNQVIKSNAIDLKGRFEPANFSVYINDKKIDANNGSFSYKQPLEIGENKIEIRVANFKSVEKELTIIRELTEEELAQQNKKEEELVEEQAEIEQPTHSPVPTGNSGNDLAVGLTENTQQNNQALFLVTRVIDGDTLEIQGGEKVRLIGINTPESGDCYFNEAKNKLSDLVLNKKVELKKDISETDRYQRLLRYIYVDEIFVNDVLVSDGYANASSYPPDVKFQEQFRQSEAQARSQNKGLWSTCSSPTAVPTPKSTNTGSEPTTGTPIQETGSCVIKGNISYSSGEKIYHTPGQRDYEKTVIDTSNGERWFCTESEAQSAGWRKAKR